MLDLAICVAEHIYSMKIIYKVIKYIDTVEEITIKDVDYVTVGKRSLSYRKRGKKQFIFTMRLDEVHHLRILEDDDETKGVGS